MKAEFAESSFWSTPSYTFDIDASTPTKSKKLLYLNIYDDFHPFLKMLTQKRQVLQRNRSRLLVGQNTLSELADMVFLEVVLRLLYRPRQTLELGEGRESF